MTRRVYPTPKSRSARDAYPHLVMEIEDQWRDKYGDAIAVLRAVLETMGKEPSAGERDGAPLARNQLDAGLPTIRTPTGGFTGSGTTETARVPTVVVRRRNVPIAEIRPVAKRSPELRPVDIERGMTIPDSFFEPFPDDIMAAFRGKSSSRIE